MTPASLRRRRCAAQLLVPGGRSAGQVAAQLLAVQAQDPRAARLALRTRGVEAVDETAVVTTWLLRGTLHLVAVEDLGWLHALTGRLVVPQVERRLAELGVRDADRGLAAIARVLGDGPLARAEIAAQVGADGLAHLLALAASRGIVVVVAGGNFALTEDVMGGDGRSGARLGGGGTRGIDRGTAPAELARRYLRGHGPAAPEDLAAWSGLGLRAARAGFAAIAGELRADGDLADLRDRPDPPARVPPRLLPPFDPYLLGWRDRGFAVAPEHARRIHPGGGILRATVLVDGRAAGTWSRAGGAVAIEPFAPLPARVAAGLRREADSVAAFLGA